MILITGRAEIIQLCNMLLLGANRGIQGEGGDRRRAVRGEIGVDCYLTSILSRKVRSFVSKLQPQTHLMSQAFQTWTRPGFQDCHQMNSN